MAEKITPRAQDYAQWYLDVVKEAGLAENSDVRGCMVIKPTGYAIWEKMQRALDGLFKDSGHVNAYFPLFIPKSFLAKEEEMAEGFAKECAVVTHYRLKAEKGKGLYVDPAAELDAGRLGVLIERIQQLRCQLVVTTLAASYQQFGRPDRVFHVEPGRVLQL